MAGAPTRASRETWDLVRSPIATERLARPQQSAPELIMLLCGDRLLGAKVALAAHAEQEAFALLREQGTIPGALRTTDAALERTARAALGPRVEISVGHEPVVASLATMLGAEILKLTEAPRPFPEAASKTLLTAFHEAAARLWAAQPWDAVPSEDLVLSARTLRWPDGCLQVIGQLGESMGILLFRTEEDQARFEALAEALAEGRGPDAVTDVDMLSVDFEESADVDAAWRRKVSRLKLRLAARGVYPFVRGIRSGSGPRFADLEDLREATALAEAVARFVETHGPALLGELTTPISERYAITVDGSPLTVEITAPHPNRAWSAGEPADPISRLVGDLESWSGLDGLDEDRLGLTLFIAENLCVYHADYLGAPLDRWTSPQLEGFMLEHLPRKITLEDADIDRVPEALQRFVRFLAASGRVDARTEEELLLMVAKRRADMKRAARDPRNFGMAKSLFAGVDFDLGSLGSASGDVLAKGGFKLPETNVTIIPREPPAKGKRR